MLALKMEGACARTRDFELLTMSPSQQLLRKWGPQSHNNKNLNSANRGNEFGSEFFPRASRQEFNLARTLILAL